MSPRSARALLAVLALLFVAGPTAGMGTAGAQATGSAPATGGSGLASVAPHNGTVEPAEQVMRVELRPRGNARWHVSVRFPLETRNDTAAFQELAAQFETGDSEALALDTFREAAARSGADSGRTMRIRNVTRSHRVENDTGVLVLSFTWTNFAERRGDRLVVGDAFNTSTGPWLPSLTAQQTLLIAPPEGYGVLSSPPVAVENGVARWTGPLEFTGRGPWIVYAGDAGTETPPPTSPSTPTTVTTTSPPPGDGDDSSSIQLIVLVALVGGGVALLGAYALRRGSGGVPGAIGGSGSESGRSAGADADEVAGTGDATTADSAPGPAPGRDDAAGGTTGAAGAETVDENEDEGGDEEDTDEVDVTLLSDEERVERLLEQNGGRMKQASIVKETGWSNAKVSQLLSSMEEEGRIDKLRIGRENLISFPDEDITDFDS